MTGTTGRVGAALARAFAPRRGPRRSGRRILLGLGGVLLGLVLLVFAVSLPAIWLGVIAFLLMLAGAVYAVTTPTRSTGDTGQGDAEGDELRDAGRLGDQVLALAQHQTVDVDTGLTVS